MGRKDEHSITANLDALRFTLGATLRYGLEHKAADAGLIVGLLMDNIELFNGEWLQNFIADINRYAADRERGRIFDSTSEYNDWMLLRQELEAEYKRRGFDRMGKTFIPGNCLNGKPEAAAS